MIRLYNEKEKTMCVVTKKDGYVLASVIETIKKFGFTLMNQGGK